MMINLPGLVILWVSVCILSSPPRTAHVGNRCQGSGVGLGTQQEYSLCQAEGVNLRSHFTGGVLRALLVKLLKAAEGMITKSLLLACLCSHKHLKSFSPALDVPQHPYPYGC